MSKYKLIEDLGLQVFKAKTQPQVVSGNPFLQIQPQYKNCVSADDLLKVLESGVRVKGNKMRKDNFPDNWAFDSKFEDNTTTHTALLIGLKPIEKPEPVSMKEIDKALNEDASIHLSQSKVLENWRDLLVKIKKNGIKNDPN